MIWANVLHLQTIWLLFLDSKANYVIKVIFEKCIKRERLYTMSMAIIQIEFYKLTRLFALLSIINWINAMSNAVRT